MNIENVVKGLECCTEQDKCDKKCPYWNSDKSCWINLKKDALALLKAQEPVKPKKVNRYFDFDDETQPTKIWKTPKLLL